MKPENTEIERLKKKLNRVQDAKLISDLRLRLLQAQRETQVAVDEILAAPPHQLGVLVSKYFKQAHTHSVEDILREISYINRGRKALTGEW